MKTPEQWAVEASKLYQEAMKIKDEARKSDNNISLFNDAAKKYKLASIAYENYSVNPEIKNVNDITQANAFKEYYLFESNECSYSFDYKNGRYSEAKNYALSAQSHIENALNIIDNNFSSLDDNTKTHLLKMKINWLLSQKTIKIKIVEADTKPAMNAKDYITAMDGYTKMDELQDDVYLYLQNAEIDQVHKRIGSGNYYAAKASIANSKAGVFIGQQSTGNDYKIEILQQFINSIEHISKAIDVNPEWSQYKTGKEHTIKNVQKILNDFPEDWLRYYLHFENNETLKQIMKQTDLEKFNEIELKRKLNADKPKSFLIYGCFWLAAIILIAGMISILFTSFDWRIVILIMLLTQFAYAMLSATVLRNLGDLSEKNFMEIYKMVIKLNLNLFNKNKPN